MKTGNKNLSDMDFLVDYNVYIYKTDNGIIFYDTRTGKSCVYNGKKCYIEKNVITGEQSDPEFNSLVVFMTKQNMGREVTQEHPAFQFTNEFNVLKNEFEECFNDERGNILKDLLVEITIQINCIPQESIHFGITHSLLLNHNNNEIINIHKIKNIFNTNTFRNLKKIILTGHHLHNSKEFYDLISFFEDKYPVEIQIPFSEFIHLNSNLLLQPVSIRLIGSVPSFNLIKEKIPNNQHIILDIYIKDMSEFEKTNKYIENNRSLNINIHPYFCQNISFLNKILSYTTKEIQQERHNKMSIIRKGLINELFWGKIVICNNGDVYAGTNESLGNILTGNFQNIFEKANDQTHWRYTRKRFLSCGKCYLNCLCPPVTQIEVLSNKTYCNMSPLCDLVHQRT